MISPELWNKAKALSEVSKNENISSIIRKALESYLEGRTKNNLAYKMKTMITDYVDDEEQREIEETLSNLSNEDLETGEIIEL